MGGHLGHVTLNFCPFIFDQLCGNQSHNLGLNIAQIIISADEKF